MPAKTGFWAALFLDVPYVLDSVWRKTEFAANRAGTLSLTQTGSFLLREPAWTPLGALFVLITIYFCFGPTFESLCTVAGTSGFTVIRRLFGLAVLGGTFRLLKVLSSRSLAALTRRYDRVFPHKRPAGANLRIWTARITVLVGLVLLTAPLWFLAIYQFHKTSACLQSPHTSAATVQILVTLVTIFAGIIILRHRDATTALRRFIELAGVLLVAGIVLWIVVAPLMYGSASEVWRAPANYLLNQQESAGGPYVNMFAVLLLAMTLTTLAAYYLAKLCFSKWTPLMTAKFRGRLHKVQLLTNERHDPKLTHVRYWAALLNGVAYHPLHILLPAAIGALMSPAQWMWLLALGFMMVSILFVMWGSLSSRWQQLVTYFERWFLSGTPLLVSVAVITLAILRLADMQYVSTVLNAAPFGWLFNVVVMAYAALWYSEYWINRWAGERLLELLGDLDVTRTFLRYGASPGLPNRAQVKAGVVLALHSTGRFAVHGWYWANRIERKNAQLGFTTYSYGGLFATLGKGLNHDYPHNIMRRLRLYFVTVNAVLACLFCGLMYLHSIWTAPLAQRSALDADSRPAVASRAAPLTLESLIVRQAKEGRPVLIVAASGGGTRAAVYTEMALHGLARLNRTRDIALLSGVSGGGVAAAYFAGHPDLLKSADDPSWNSFLSAMEEPFIQDVLDGALELRIAGNVALGQLLQESFSRRLFDSGLRGKSLNTLGALKDVGLILNTTVTGHPPQFSSILSRRVAYAHATSGDCANLTRPFSSLAGGRLIFTNLAAAEAFPSARSSVPDVRLPYRVVMDPHVPLATAAALNANFPPVFPNARIRIQTDEIENCREFSFFVTDGGAAENLGLISALYALRDAIPKAAAQLQGTPFPAIHLVLIEASALSYDYEQDWGVGAGLGGGKERLAGGLTQTLIDQIEAGKPCPDCSLHFHFLHLPIAFRSRGGMGTHWMFANDIRVSNPFIEEPGGHWSQFWRQNILRQPQYEIISQDEITSVWDRLYQTDSPFCSRSLTTDGDEGLRRVEDWICGRDGGPPHQPDLQVEEWARTIAELRGG
jgi:Patatin-like phospholipase